MIVENVTVVIRSAGERTISVCQNLLESIFSGQDIIILQETPFSKALRKGFEIAIEKKKKWALYVDADVLCGSNVLKVLDLAEDADEKVFKIQGMMIDKLFGGIRAGGIHLYRTSALETAIKMIPDEGTSLRPESYMMKKMFGVGYKRLLLDIVIGTHDFEQYYKDISRKAYVHINKFTSWNSHKYIFNSYWKTMSNKDNDFKVAYHVFKNYKNTNEKIFVDSNKNPEYILKIPDQLNLSEKEQIIKKTSLDEIDKMITEFRSDKHFQKFKKYAGKKAANFSLKEYTKKCLKKLGIFK
ncbi:MAG: hypothetical protein MJB14_03105 [Spirochaetes bacterium]|nr:hypothetical protein [Spirochaetota bacterium]